MVLKLMGPKTAVPATAPRKMVSIAPAGPRKAPTMAIIFMSPPPMAGLRKAHSPSTPTANRTAKPRAAPRSARRGVGGPGRRDSASPAPRPPRLSTSGIR